MTAPAQQPMTRDRVEHALQLLAGIVTKSSAEDAAIMAPIYDRLERELAAMGDENDIRTRAAARLASFATVEDLRRPKGRKGRRSKSKKQTYIYFVLAGEFVKIGRSTGWRDRLAALQTGSPHPVIPLLVLPATRRTTEQRLHARFKEHRVNGEWFRPAPEIMAYIENRKADDLQPGDV